MEEKTNNAVGWKEHRLMEQNEDEVEIDLVELFYYYRSKWWMLLLAFLAGSIAAGLITYYLITPKYTATAKLYMVSASSDSIVNLTDLNLGTSLSSDYRELLKIRPLIEELIEEEELKRTYEEVLGMLTISTMSDTRILAISVESTIPSEAMVIANALAEKAVTNLPKLMETSKPNIAEQAILPTAKSSPNLTRNTMVGALAAVGLVLVVLTIVYMMDDTLNTAEEVEKYFGIMPLTVIPEGDMDATAGRIFRKKSRKGKA